jgi:hypothetical protein
MNTNALVLAVLAAALAPAAAAAQITDTLPAGWTVVGPAHGTAAFRVVLDAEGAHGGGVLRPELAADGYIYVS